MRLLLPVVLVLTVATSAAAQAVRVQAYTFRPRAQHRIGTWHNSATDSVRVYWGGFSGLRAVPGVANEFYTVTDRGPVVGASNGNKFFPFPNYSPTIVRYRLQGDSLVLLSYLPIKRPNGTNTSGRPLPANFGSTGESACSTPNCSGPNYAPDPYGLDSEGLELDGQGGYWLADEYTTGLWHVAADGRLLDRYTPWGNDPAHLPSDRPVDPVFRSREPNKGFESICRTPNGLIYASVQAPLSYPNAAAGGNSRVHRILELNPATGTTRTFFYFHKAAPTNGVNNDKIYLGDMAAINNDELLVLEHGGNGVNTASNQRNRKVIFKIDLRGATPLPQNAVLAAETLDSAGLARQGYQGVRKTAVLNLLTNGFDPSIGAAEDLAIVNDSTIAVGNDNDFAIASDNNTRLAADPTNRIKVYVFTLPRTRHLALATATKPLSHSVTLYPNPVLAGQPLHLPAPTAFEVLDATGRLLRHGLGAEVPTAGLPPGLYLLRDGRRASRFRVE